MLPILRWLWHLDTRLTEIVLGSVAVARGLSLALPGSMMSGETYAAFAFLPGAVWAVTICPLVWRSWQPW